jgi:hypothetical protein
MCRSMTLISSIGVTVYPDMQAYASLSGAVKPSHDGFLAEGHAILPGLNDPGPRACI